jgi:hypothetical protein
MLERWINLTLVSDAMGFVSSTHPTSYDIAQTNEAGYWEFDPSKLVALTER